MPKPKKSLKKNKETRSHKRSSSAEAITSSTSITRQNTTKWFPWLLFALAFVLYANTLKHEYTQDDAIVIYDNMFTQEGVSGIPGILSNDTFFGFFKEEGKAKLVAGGRYRPLTQIMYAIEWQLFGKSPFIGHFINVLMYGLLGFMLYKMLVLMLLGPNKAGQKEEKVKLYILIACLLYIAHPIHTEAVANIKGRDEIMSMLGAIIAVWASLKYKYTNATKWNICLLYTSPSPRDRG